MTVQHFSIDWDQFIIDFAVFLCNFCLGDETTSDWRSLQSVYFVTNSSNPGPLHMCGVNLLPAAASAETEKNIFLFIGEFWQCCLRLGVWLFVKMKPIRLHELSQVCFGAAAGDSEGTSSCWSKQTSNTSLSMSVKETAVYTECASYYTIILLYNTFDFGPACCYDAE